MHILFGSGNSRLVTTVEEEQPDLIFITGDLVNSHDSKDTGLAIDLIVTVHAQPPPIMRTRRSYELQSRANALRLLMWVEVTLLTHLYASGKAFLHASMTQSFPDAYYA